MRSTQEPRLAVPVLSNITPRRPLRQNMALQQTALETDSAEEGEKSNLSLPSVWEQVASWSRYHLHIPSTAKIAYYITILLALSTIQHYVDLPHVEGLTGKYTILNQVFVKKGWGFTLAVFFPYRVISLFLRPKIRASLKQLIVRSACTTFFFFIWCQVLFPVIDDLSSVCIAGNQTLSLAKAECLSKEGREYLSFDISGHSYLLTYCVLIMMEESKEILYFLWLGRLLFGDAAQYRTKHSTWPDLDKKEVKSLRRKFLRLSPLVVVAFLNMCVLALLWDFMLLVTTLYYHTFAEKVVGTILAPLMWGLLYRGTFPWLFRLRVMS